MSFTIVPSTNVYFSYLTSHYLCKAKDTSTDLSKNIFRQEQRQIRLYYITTKKPYSR